MSILYETNTLILIWYKIIQYNPVFYFYTMYLIWEGCGCLFKFDDNKKLVFTVMVFVSMVGVAGVTYLLFNKFM